MNPIKMKCRFEVQRAWEYIETLETLEDCNAADLRLQTADKYTVSERETLSAVLDGQYNKILYGF